MKIIVAVDENWAIGCGNKLLHSIPEDMKFFKEKTSGQVVVMGRATLESLPGGKPLKDRINLVLTRKGGADLEGAVFCSSIEEVLQRVRQYSGKEVYIIGGEQVYRQFLPHCESCFVTKMEASFPADKFFENLDESEDWELLFEEKHCTEEGLHYSFCLYRNLDMR
ncbi:MAG: dihydrofolate reductase [Peptostreptococcaceae bacterium]|nr:dihydrofolate reductase [Peptostreptococcaceae bacterium]